MDKPIPEESEYLLFRLQGKSESGKTLIYAVVAKGNFTSLGLIKWYGPWRQYCFFPAGPAVYSGGCLEDIQDFMANL